MIAYSRSSERAPVFSVGRGGSCPPLTTRQTFFASTVRNAKNVAGYARSGRDTGYKYSQALPCHVDSKGAAE
ncbi:hypothetical protein NDU88_004677 [Pleurodeles waltl]|uniref:Uncharacterized protein n=1 Tax=Pleurodeles waltl TaxID=8319 RepID=A0AAV7W5N0_PLEWA|nr:hypothetical protein NDU88_004677 [Pleurodeles waltl]